MSRKPSGPAEAIEWAIKTAETTQSAVDLRRALAVALPVLHGLSLKDTAVLIGRSEAWVAKERQTFIRARPNPNEGQSRGGRFFVSLMIYPFLATVSCLNCCLESGDHFTHHPGSSRYADQTGRHGPCMAWKAANRAPPQMAIV